MKFVILMVFQSAQFHSVKFMHITVQRPTTFFVLQKQNLPIKPHLPIPPSPQPLVTTFLLSGSIINVTVLDRCYGWNRAVFVLL